MSSFFECVQRMVPSAANRLELSQELELYKRSIGLFGFDMAINDRKNIMPSKFHLVLTFKFQNSFFKFQFIRLIIDLLKLFICFKLNHYLLLCFSNSL